MKNAAQAVVIDYTNWRGERSMRRIIPRHMAWTKNEWHPEYQWMVYAFDIDKNAYRFFANSSIHSWKVAETEK